MARTYLALALISLVPIASTSAQTTTRVSVASNGAQGNDHSYNSAISANGRFVAFVSEASNLVPGDTNGKADVFVHDVQTGATTRVSVDSAGVEGNDFSGPYSSPSISANGRFVAFGSAASNLVPGDTNGASDGFVHDLLTGSTFRVSLDSAGTQGNAGSYGPRISASGRFAVFVSGASNLVPNDTNGHYDIFVRDLQLGTTTRASVNSAGVQSDGGCYSPSISSDGTRVVFYAYATNLVSLPVVGTHVYLRDILAGTTTLVSVDPSGMPGQNQNCGISADGRYVGFMSASTNLVPGGTWGRQIFLRDMQTASTMLVSRSTAGVQGDAWSAVAGDFISPDGRFVAYWSEAQNLVPGDTNGAMDGFVWDRQSGTTTRVTVGASGAQSNATSGSTSLSPDGRFVAFESIASNLAPGDTNFLFDVYLRDHGPLPIFFCSGDGTATACPCGNAGASGHGCASSVHPEGGLLDATGTASVTNDSLLLQGTSMPAGASALYFQGTLQVNNGNGSVFGDGLRCAGGAIVRLGIEINTSAGSAYPSAGDPQISVVGAIPASGSTRTYQVWYRNSGGPCSSGFNLTNGVLITWTP